MENQQSPHSSQEKLVAALACFLFFIPILMDVKTDFVVKYMKQGFFLNVVSVLCIILSSLFWTMSSFITLINLATFVIFIILAVHAFSGKEYIIAFIYNSAEKIIHALKIEGLFIPRTK